MAPRETASAGAAPATGDDNEEHFLLVAYDDAVERLSAAIAIAGRREDDWPIAVWTAVSAALSFFAADPAAARLILIDAPGAGDAALARHRASLRRLEAMLREGRQHDAYAVALPPLVEQVIVGGIHAACAERLADGEAAQLPDLAPQLTETALAPYLGPRRAARAVRAGEELYARVRFVRETTGTLRPLPVGPHRIPRAEVRADQRQRLFVAVAELLGEPGVSNLPIALLVERARVSKATFYENFSDVGECLLAAYEDAERCLWREIEDAAAEGSDWASQVDAAVAAVLNFFADRPSLVYLFDLEGRAADRSLARRREETLERLVAGLRAGRRSPLALELPAATERVLIEHGLILVRMKINAGEAARLPELEGRLAELLLTASRAGAAARA